MDNNGRYTHIEDVLINLHDGQWFSWSDPYNKVYANLKLSDQILILKYELHESNIYKYINLIV